MNPREATDPTEAGFTETDQLTASASEPAPDDISTVGTTQVGGGTGDATSGSGGAVDTSGTGWSDAADTAEPPPDDIATAGTTQVPAADSSAGASDSISEH